MSVYVYYIYVYIYQIYHYDSSYNIYFIIVVVL